VALFVLPGTVSAAAAYRDQSAAHRSVEKDQAANNELNNSARSGSSSAMPVMFVENVGQFAEGARFQARGSSGALWLAPDAIWITAFDSAVPAGEANERPGVDIKLSFVGANADAVLQPFDRLDAAVSYFNGSSPADWFSNVPVWGGVRYVDLYPGVNLTLSGTNGQWSWQLECAGACGPALQNVRLLVEGADGVRADNGLLQLQTAIGEKALPLPELAHQFQPAQTVVTAIGERAFEVAAPMRAGSRMPLRVRDNVELIYSGFLGGSDWDEARGNAVDADEYAYVTGGTWSTNFPIVAGPDPTHNGNADAFVAKVNQSGSALIYAGFVGGSAYDYGNAIAVDPDGNAYFTGETRSSNFPTLLGPDLSYNGNTDAFVAKLNAAGNSLVYSGFMGGGLEDKGTGIAVGNNSAYVGGRTESQDFPTAVGPDLTYNGGVYDGFVFRVNPPGTGVIFSSFLGGTAWDEITDIAVDGSGNGYVTGGTGSDDFPTLIGPDMTYNGSADGFVTKVNLTGTAWVCSGYVGGTGWDEGHGIAVDTGTYAYITGETASSDFPALVGPMMTIAGAIDAFVTKVDAACASLVYSGYLGGAADDMGHDIAVDADNSAYVTGFTKSQNFPAVVGPFLTYGGNTDGYITKLDTAGSSIVFSGYMGGTSEDWGAAIAVDADESAYLAGGTRSVNFPVLVGPDLTHNSGMDGWVAKFDTAPPTAVGLSGLTAQPAGWPTTWLLLLALAGLLAAGLIVANQLRRRLLPRRV
jgi:hypothetical protein